MIALLYSSRKGATKKFSKDGTDLGWESIVQLHEDDMKRAEKGCSMAVPDMKESYVIHDAWTRLNVKPAKIMQQNDVIQALNKKKDPATNATNNYLKACNALFEEGILKKTPVTGTDSEQINKNIKKGFSFFEEWLDDILEQEPNYNTKASKQKKFLSWQTWDLLRIMVNGFLGLCQDFTKRHPGYFIVPVKINGSALKTIFSQLKFRTGGNLSATNYASSLANLSTSREVAGRRKRDSSYRADELYLRSHEPKRIRS